MAEVPGVGGEENKLGPNPSEEYWKQMFSRTEGFAEFAQGRTPEEVIHSARMFGHTFEAAWHEHSVNPPTYVIDNQIIPQALQRVVQLEVSIPLDRVKPSRADKEAGLVAGKFLKPPEEPVLPGDDSGIEEKFQTLEITEDEAEKNRTNLARTIQSELKGIRARQELVEKVTEQSIFEGDDEQYMVAAFLRLGKARMESKNYGIILNLPPTEKDFDPYGEKVEKAFDAVRALAEGKAVITVTKTLSDGTTKTQNYRLPNPFALQRNKQILDIAIDHFIVPQIGFTTEGLGKTSKERALRKLEEIDNRAAAIEALILTDHFDLDAEYAVGSDGYKEDWSLEDITELDYEGSFKDLVKALYPEQRRLGEWEEDPNQLKTKRERREHPRVSGSPITLGCYPRLTTDVLNLLSVEVPVARVGGVIETLEFDKEKKAMVPSGESDAVYKIFKEVMSIGKTKIERAKALKEDSIRKDTTLESLKKLGLDRENWDVLLNMLSKNKYIVKELKEKLLANGPEKLEKVEDILRLLRFKRMSLPIEELVYNPNHPDDSRRGKKGEEGRIVKEKTEWIFRKRKLRQIPWDAVTFLDSPEGPLTEVEYKVAQGNVKPEDAMRFLNEFALGVPTNAFDIPYKLQGFYAHKYIFSQIMRVDYEKLYSEIISGPEYLLKMNKGIDVAINMMSGAFNLDKSTSKKLNNYIRTIFLGGLAASITKRGYHGAPGTEKLEEREQVPYLRALDKGTAANLLEEAAMVSSFLPVVEDEKTGKRTLKTEYQNLYNKIVNERKVPTPFEWGEFTKEEKEELSPLYPHIPVR